MGPLGSASLSVYRRFLYLTTDRTTISKNLSKVKSLVYSIIILSEKISLKHINHIIFILCFLVYLTNSLRTTIRNLFLSRCTLPTIIIDKQMKAPHIKIKKCCNKQDYDPSEFLVLLTKLSKNFRVIRNPSYARSTLTCRVFSRLKFLSQPSESF